MSDDFLNEFRKKFTKNSSKEEQHENNEIKKETENDKESEDLKKSIISSQSQPQNKIATSVLSDQPRPSVERGRVSHFIKKNLLSRFLSSDSPEKKNEKPNIAENKIEEKKEEKTMAQIVEDKSNYFTSSSVQDQINAINERTSTNKPALLNHLHIETDTNKREEQAPRNSTNLRPQIITEPRKSVKDLLKLNEERLKLFKEQKEEEERRKSIKIKNRDEWRLKMQKLAEFIRNEKDVDETDQDFYDDNADYFKDYGITNFKDFMSIQETIDFYENANKKEDTGRRNTYSTNPLKKVNVMAMSAIQEKEEEDNVIISKQDNVEIIKQSKPIEFFQNQRMTYTPVLRNYNKYNKIELVNDYTKNDVSYMADYKLRKFKIEHSYNNCFLVDKYDKVNKKNKQCKENNVNYQQEYVTKKYNNLVNSKGNDINIEKYVNPKHSNRNISHNFKYEYQGVKKEKKNYSICNDQVNIDIATTFKSKAVNVLQRENNYQYISTIVRPVNKTSYEGIDISNINNMTIRGKRQIKKENKIIWEGDYEIPSSYHRKTRYNFESLFISHSIIQISYNAKIKSTSYQIAFFVTNQNVAATKRKKIISMVYHPEIEYEYHPIEHKEYEIESNTISLSNQVEPQRVKAKPNPKRFEQDNLIENNENIDNTQNTSALQKFKDESHLNSQYQKNIITSLDSISVMKYQINNSKIPLDPSFMDVLCINCYECVKFSEMDKHSASCIIGIDQYKDNDYDQDYNTRIYKLHESLKLKKAEINETQNQCLINFYNKLLQIIYEILINNNSIEELDASITSINSMIKNDIDKITQNYKFYFLVFSQRISQLVYLKLKDMEKLLIVNKENIEDDLLNEDEYNWYTNNQEEENDEQVKYMKMQLTTIENQTEQAKNELNHWKKEAKMLENNLRRPNVKNNGERLSEIVSDVNSRAESVDIMTTFSGQTSDMGDFDMGGLDNAQMTEEDLKKCFLSMGLGVKFKYSDQIKDSVSIADLYEKAKKLNIAPCDYQTFLLKELGIQQY